MKKILVVVIVVALIAAYFIFDLGQFLNLEYIKAQQGRIMEYRDANPVQTALLFFVLYILITGLSLPGAAIITLVAGAIFGLVIGSILVSFASSIGATCAFLVSRYVLRDSIQSRYGDKLRAINEGVEKDGALYLFTLRLVPLFPFFVINLLMGLTPISTKKFYIVSQIGMLAGTVVYVNAGTQLAKIDSLSGILSPALIASFVLLGIFPLLAKKVIDVVKSRKVLGKFPKPKKFDFNVVVIGAGSAGLVAAYIAAAVKAKVALVEKGSMGGDCLNTGCVPSKALIRTAKFMAHQKRSAKFGIHTAHAEFEFSDVMARIRRVISNIEPHDSVERYTGLGVDCFSGSATIESPYSVDVDGKKLTTKSIVIAAGAEPFVPPVPGIDEMDYLTSDTLWEMEQLPQRLVILGGGPIGSELAQAFARLGSNVTQVEMLSRILPREDQEFSEMVMEKFRADGVNVLVDHRAEQFLLEDGVKTLVCKHKEEEVKIQFDALIVAVGRKARTSGYGIEELGIELSMTKTIQTNEFLETNFPNVYACGDVSGPYQFTHVGAHQATYASTNALLRPFYSRRVDYSVIPWATFTDPEVARVGLNELEALEKGVQYEVTRYDMKDLSRAIADEETHGCIKILTVPGKDKILGVTIAGDHAGDVIAEFILAMQHGLGLNKILGAIHIYPTLSESVRLAAGNWRRAHVSAKAIAFLERFHKWRRG